MSNSTAAIDLTPSIAGFIRRDGDGRPFLEGSRCRSCGYTYVGHRTDCARCYARDSMDGIELATTGELFTWSVVHRSFPGIKTPFIDAIVDLSDGTHVKGVLRGIDPDPEKLEFGMKVKVVFDEVIPFGQETPYLAYFFESA